MTLRHLNIFMEVCRSGSITRAAEELNMAQPAVSYAIRELESYYGVRLFERMNRRLYITEAGEQLMSYADSILVQFEEAKEVLKDRNAAAKIRIGTNVSYSVSKLPKLISGFRREHPEIPVYVRVENSAQIEEALIRNGLDFGIIDYPVKSELFFCDLLEEDPVTVACSPDFVMEAEGKIIEGRQQKGMESAEEKAKTKEQKTGELPFLLRESGSGLRNTADRIIQNMEKKGICPVIVMESTSIQSLIGACMEGMGLLVLPRNVLRPYLEDGRLKEIPIGGVNLVRQYYLVYHKSKFLTKSMKAFKEYVLLGL